MLISISTSSNPTPATYDFQYVLQNEGVYQPVGYDYARILSFEEYGDNTLLYVDLEDSRIHQSCKTWVDERFIKVLEPVTITCVNSQD